MATCYLTIQGDIKELKSFFLGLLENVAFKLIQIEESEKYLKMIGANKERISQLIVALNSLFGGYVHKNRITIELTARTDGTSLETTVKSIPYLDILDIEAKEYTKSEQERCEKLVKLFSDQMIENFS